MASCLAGLQTPDDRPCRRHGLPRDRGQHYGPLSPTGRRRCRERHRSGALHSVRRHFDRPVLPVGARPATAAAGGVSRRQAPLARCHHNGPRHRHRDRLRTASDCHSIGLLVDGPVHDRSGITHRNRLRLAESSCCVALALARRDYPRPHRRSRGRLHVVGRGRRRAASGSASPRSPGSCESRLA